MVVLITGFDPFGGEKINPSYEAVKLLPDEIGGHTIYKMELPTVVNKSTQKVIDKIEEIKPNIVINVGQAGGRTCITPEKVAINLNDFNILDNEGNKCINERIREDAPDGYFATLPINAIVEDLKKNNIPAKVSYTAGTFVCNHVMFGVLDYIKVNNLNIKSGFVHIPYIYEQVVDKPNNAAMSLESVVKGLRVCIESCIKNQVDVKVSNGMDC